MNCLPPLEQWHFKRHLRRRGTSGRQPRLILSTASLPPPPKLLHVLASHQPNRYCLAAFLEQCATIPSIPHFHQYHLLPTSVAHHISVINSTTIITTTPTTTCLFHLLRHHYYYATHSLKEDINRITLHHESVQLPSSKLPHTTITIVPLNVLCPVFIPTAANVYIAI